MNNIIKKFDNSANLSGDVQKYANRWIESLIGEQLLSENTHKAYYIDLNYFFNFISEHKGKTISTKIIEELNLLLFLA